MGRAERVARHLAEFFRMNGMYADQQRTPMKEQKGVMAEPTGGSNKDPMYQKRSSLPTDDPMTRGNNNAAPPYTKPQDKYKGGSKA